jgi:hypothetical protein
MKLDVLCSTSDWAFMMAEADALQTEDPAGCIETALIRAKSRGEPRYELVVAELRRRLSLRRRCAEPGPDWRLDRWKDDARRVRD